ncbi:MAG: hypothetical protein COU46_03285 [Candidatus Niyogibacteria bacterium CG10_big_fil_rev_8_21_14_0_10_42_19]|uniref:EfeO-type cupredoxin-like domain-containing protein n=1 Tax=Candidatus Niyogibacteria bacterium CG10_big_fil_rev_8_21_14_0_10_42_19 TaxID=1974725 RepID=A0A2H0TEX7_9BACT|nr:MAG: hypothetical protein COU46_03285 [Candidatus Niyogibacteria bacterium CG10_big_fil_rev_8_21_14_0_10_42_19]
MSEQQKMSNGVNKTVVTIAIIAVVLVGGYLLFFSGVPQQTPSVLEPSSEQPITQPPVSEQPSQQPPASQVPAVKENVVTYTNSGYSPSTLTIKKGETVTFKNQSSQSMWVASAVHPTHREYPTTGGCLGSTFDACAGIQPGNSWSFKFDISGTWKYHNHLSPSDTGAIVVE